MIELKPCPFCGNMPRTWKTSDERVAVNCNNKSCLMFQEGGVYAEYWNNRPLEDTLQAKLDEYEKANWNAVLEITEVRKKLDIAVEALEDSKSRLLELRDEELVKDLSVFKSCAMRIYSDIDEALKKLEEK